MAASVRKRGSQPNAGPSGVKKVKRNEPAKTTDLYEDPMIDPTDSSGSEMDDEPSGSELDDEDDDDEEGVEDFDGIESGAEDGDAAVRSVEETGPEPSLLTSAPGPSSHASQPTSKTRSKNLYAPATADELDRLRTARETGNTFTLQLEDLVSRTLLPVAPHPATKDLLSKLHDLILGLPALEAASPREAVKRTKDIPFVGGEEWSPVKGKGTGAGTGVNWTLGWEKPGEVFVGGSWAVVGGYKRGKGVVGDVDLVVVMPKSLFSPKDRLDYRYFHKRSHYLAVIKSAITKSFSKDAALREIQLEWSYAMDDPRRPIILLKAGKAQGLKHATEIKIHASLPSDVFTPAQLSPAKPLCRIGPITESNDKGEAGSDDSRATPLYASSIAHDTLHKSHLLHLNRLSTSLGPSAERHVASFLALWRIWATQRSIPASRGASAWFAGMILGWIVQGGKIGGQGGVRERTKEVNGLGKGLGYWGCLRAAWEFLARTDFWTSPVWIGHDEAPIPASHFLAAREEKANGQNVMVDPEGMVNVFADWEDGEVQLLRHHARETLAMLEDHSVDRFGEVFARGQKGQVGVFDEVVVVDISSAQVEASLHAMAEKPSRTLRIAHAIPHTLRLGFSDRASIVHVSTLSPSHLSIGLIFNPSQATRVLDVGPSSDQTDAGEAFRALWGDKAELRRFKDGSIAESVVWPISRPEDAALIPSNIVKWLLLRHFAVQSTDVHVRYAGEEWLGITQIPASARDAVCVQGAEKQGFAPINKAYDELYRLLKSIDTELPLAILNVSPADEALRYSSPFIPHPIDVARSALAPDCLRYVPSAEVVLQFESSPRWPDHLGAIQKVKLAIFEKLARVIMDKVRHARAEIVFDHAVIATQSEIEDQAGLEVLMPNGTAFTLRIHHEKERTHLERIIDGDAPAFGTSLPLPRRRLAVPALAHYMTRFVHRPAHHSAIQPLHSRFPSFSSATRLLKRWTAAHMLSLHVPSEAVELIMASVYLDSGSTTPPASAGAGFTRAIQRLATWAYDEQPLIVPLVSATHDASYAKGATEQEILQSHSGRARFPLAMRKEAEELFAQRHQQTVKANGAAKGNAHAYAEGKGAWTIVTEQDITGRRWTGTMPSRVVAGRVRQLAGATLAELTNGQQLLSVKSLFKTPLSDYDVLIHLRPSLLPRYAQAVDPSAHEWESRNKLIRNAPAASGAGMYGSDVKVNFDPASTFARDLQRLYGDGMVVFHDDLGGRVIGLLFNPSNKQPRAFKPFLGYSTRPVQSKSELVEVNREAVLGEIARMGEGLVERIERGSAFA